MADFEETVTRKDGSVTRVVASDKKELADAVKAVKDTPASVSIDINVPVKKGHDLVELSDGGVTQGLADGTGAHNSPRDAIRDDGSVEGSDPLLVHTSDAANPDTVSEVTGSGETKEVDPAKVEIPSEELNVPSNE